MKYIYGPVPSRRLGFSLGVDIVPYKTCTLDCIYCQIGRTTCKSIGRKSYISKDHILREIEGTLHSIHNIDFITFSGSGEPTLNSDIGELIKKIKAVTSIPVAVLTNGTLLFMEDVRKDLLEADVVLPSLDAASQEMFEKINRPHPVLHADSIINGLERFRELYKGRIWMEVMLIKNYNDNAEELLRIKNAISEIQPDRIYLNSVIRPPSEIYAKPLSSDEMMTVKNYFDNHCEVIAEFHGQRVGEAQNVEDSIIEMAKRRPVTIVDIANVLGISESNAKKWVNGLKKAGRLKEKQYQEKKYYSLMSKK